MNKRLGMAFAALIALQALHSIEELVFRLYEVFPPIVYLYRDAPQLARPAFIAFNVLLVLAGVICLVRWVWSGRPGTRVVVWIWIAGEAFNAAAHSAWWLVTQQYNPGLGTGVVMLPLVAYLGYLSRRDTS